MDTRLSVYDRLEQYAERGLVSHKLNLYSRQAEKLLREGLAVQRGLPVPGWKGQFECMVGWRYAIPGTVAWRLLEISAEHNPQLKEELSNPSDERTATPYEPGWQN